MIFGKPDGSQAGFLALLGEMIAAVAEGPPHFSGSIPCTARPDDLAFVHAGPQVRVGMQLEGLQNGVISVLGKRAEIQLSPGQCIYLPPYGWYAEFQNTIGRAFGMVLRPDCVRLIQVVYTGQAPTGPTPWFYHTALPLGGSAIGICQALNSLAEEANRSDWGRDLFVALLRIVRRHVEEDDPSQHVHGRAQQTWVAVRTYIDEQFSSGMTRETVATAMGLHPNYLSALAKQVTGGPFRAALEEARMRHARHLLRASNLKVTRIAALCGYDDPGHFIKVFHRVAGVTPGQFRKRGPDAEQ